MGEKLLVDGLTEDTKSLIANLDESQKKCSLVAWYYYPDSDEWKLLLAGQWLDDLLPNQEAIAYQKIAQAIKDSSLNSLSISFIRLLKRTDHIAEAISMLIGTDMGPLGHMHFTGTSLNGIYIDEMLIMRSVPRGSAT